MCKIFHPTAYTHTHTCASHTHTLAYETVSLSVVTVVVNFTSLDVSLSLFLLLSQVFNPQIAKHTHTAYTKPKQYKYIPKKILEYQLISRVSPSCVHFVNVSHKCAKFSPFVVCVCVCACTKVPKVPTTTTTNTATATNTSMYIKHL